MKVGDVMGADDGATRAPDLRRLLGAPDNGSGQTFRQAFGSSYDLKNRHWSLVSGIAAPFAGSAIAVCLWSVIVFRAATTMAGMSPKAMTRAAKIVATSMAAFAAVHMIATLANSGFGAWLEFIPLFAFVAPLFVFPYLLQSDGRLIAHLFCVGSAIGTVLASVLVAGQMLAGGQRVEGFLGNSAVFATVLAVSGALGALNMRHRGPIFWLGCASLAGMVFCVLASETRTLWAAIPVNLLLVLTLLYRSMPLARTSGIAIAAVLTMVGLAVAFGPTLQKRVDQAFNDIRAIEVHEDYDSSLGLRYVMWSAAAEAALERPFLGYGMKDTMAPVQTVLHERQLFERGYTHPHNAALYALLGAGIPGLITLVAMLLAPLWLVLSSSAPRFVKCFVSIVVLDYFIAGLAGLAFHHDILDALFITAIMIAVAASDQLPGTEGPSV